MKTIRATDKDFKLVWDRDNPTLPALMINKAYQPAVTFDLFSQTLVGHLEKEHPKETKIIKSLLDRVLFILEEGRDPGEGFIYNKG